MNDFLYILGTLLFFALMLGYVRACEALGRRESSATTDAREQRS